MNTLVRVGGVGGVISYNTMCVSLVCVLYSVMSTVSDIKLSKYIF